MTQDQRLALLQVPAHPVDVVLDTDAYNEIDDQFAIAYLLRSCDKLNTKAIYAAPFFNDKSTGPADGMEKSYDEIDKVLSLCGVSDMPVFKGSTAYLPDEKTPVESEAARDLVERSKAYDTSNPLYVVAIGAITNVASAFLMDPSLSERVVVVWLGGNARWWRQNAEFNLMQDVAAGRVVFASGAPVVQLPCMGVVSTFAISEPELKEYLVDKNPLADYLARNTIAYENRWHEGQPWSKPIWDVTAVAWLLNDGGRFMYEETVDTVLPGYDHQYEKEATPNLPMKYITEIYRSALYADLFEKLLRS